MATIIATEQSLRKKFIEIKKILYDSSYNITSQYKIINLLVTYSNYYDNDVDDDDDDNTIFTITDERGNNLLLYCCVHDLRLLCNDIIINYNNLFNIGATNHKFETALIISIKNNMFDVANNLVNKYNNNLGQADIYGKTALDYMLDKIKFDDNGKPKLVFNDYDNKLYIKIIIKLLQFYAAKVHNDRLQYIDRGPRNDVIVGDTDNYKTLQNYIDLICKNIDFWEPLLSGANFTGIRFTSDICKPPIEAEASYKINVLNKPRDVRSTSNFYQTLPIASNPRHILPIRQNDNTNSHLFEQSYQQVAKNTSMPQPENVQYYDPANPSPNIIRYEPPPNYNPANELIPTELGNKRPSEKNNNSWFLDHEDRLGGNNKRSRIRKRKKHAKTKKSKKRSKTKTQNKKPKKK